MVSRGPKVVFSSPKGSDKEPRIWYIQPLEGRNLGNLSRLRSLRCRKGRDGVGRDLGGVVRVGPLLYTGEGVAAVGGGRGAGARGTGCYGRGCGAGARDSAASRCCRRHGGRGTGHDSRGGATGGTRKALGVVFAGLYTCRTGGAAGRSCPACSAALATISRSLACRRRRLGIWISWQARLTTPWHSSVDLQELVRQEQGCSRLMPEGYA